MGLRSRMQKLLLFIGTGLIISVNPLFSQRYIADYQISKEEILRSIPREYIDKAREELVIAYQHTSHGTHVSRGMYGLPGYKAGDDTLFAITRYTQEAGKLYFMDERMEIYPPYAKDLSDEFQATFVETTRNFLDAVENAQVNVVMWAWCDISEQDVATNYLPGMDSLIAEYGVGGSKIGSGVGQRALPVHFVFQTGFATRNFNLGPGRPFEQAQLIIDHCSAHNYLCLDYYSIDTHDMDDNYWVDAGDDGDSEAYGGSFYQDYQDAHTVGDGYYENLNEPGGEVRFGTHTTQHITSNRKAYAMWWILARLAGWDGTVQVQDVLIAAEGTADRVVTGGEVQFSGTVLPEFATIQDVGWSVINNDGSASISEEGLLRGGQPGIIQVVATALDGSGASDTLDVTIAEAPVPLTDIRVSATGGSTEMNVQASLQCRAATLPADATNPTVLWSVNNLSGSAQIGPDGLLTALQEGEVEVIATAEDGSGVSASLSITIFSAAAAVMVTGIDIIPEGGLSSIEEGSSLQFTASVLPEDASNPEVLWSVDPGSGTASISESGMLTALEEGTVDVVASARDGSGISSKFTLTISGPTGLPDGKEAAMRLFPNPSTGQFYLDAGDQPVDRLELISLGGSQLKVLVPESNDRLIEVDLWDRQPGVYFIQIFTGDQHTVQRIIINR